LTGLVAGILHAHFPPRLSQFAVLGLVTFELCFHGMNQVFNATVGDPRKTLSYDYVTVRKQALQFLRSDAGKDFHATGNRASQWDNGWNLWRIPGIYGWNPVMLGRYQEYVCQFTHCAAFAQPYGGPDQKLDSPMLDLLGVRYLVVDRTFEEEQNLKDLPNFE